MNENMCMPLIGDVAPEFVASTTNGVIKFPNDFRGKWVVLFSHPSDFTPVCTTEFIEFQQNMADFKRMNTVLIGLSVGSLPSHLAWLDSMSKMQHGAVIEFPLIDDLDKNIAKKYGMIHAGASDTHAVRAVFIIDSNAKIRVILYYPAVLGRNINEIKRMVMGLQVVDRFGVALPVNWAVGDDVIVPAPTKFNEVQKNIKQNPWFLSLKKLTKKEIYEKIYKKNIRKK